MRSYLFSGMRLRCCGVTPAALAADLWPEESPSKRRPLLTTALSHTRTALATGYGSKPVFIPKDRTISITYLSPEYFDADVWRFDALTGVRGGTETAKIDAFMEALALYRGEVAHGIEHANKLTEPYENWLRPLREEYWRRLIDTHQGPGELLRESDPERALDVLDRAVKMEPWNQRLHESPIAIQLDLGQRHAAERCFRELSELLTALGTQPSAAVAGLLNVRVPQSR
jgi:DNA-binding SARP family transcriptional activator